MNQHYVPEFYLRNFSSNGKRIFVYDKALKKSFSNSISSVASQHSFYDDSKQNSIETKIGNVESATGTTLKTLLESLHSDQFVRISSDDKEILIKFIWLQMNRTVESRIHLGSVQPHLFSKLADISFEIDANEMLKQTEISDNHIDFINTSLEHKFALTEFGSRNFILVKNETTTDFFTSDDPVIRHLHSEISLRVYELFLPISPKFGIWIFPKGIFKELDEADQILYTFTDPQNIMFYNFLQVYRSTRQVFSFSSDFSYVEQLLKENPSFGNINKQRLH